MEDIPRTVRRDSNSLYIPLSSAFTYSLSIVARMEVLGASPRLADSHLQALLRPHRQTGICRLVIRGLDSLTKGRVSLYHR